MVTYWVLWLAVIVLAAMTQSSDYPSNGRLTCGPVFHTGSAGFTYFLASAALIFVAGFRYYVGTDFGGYYSNYRTYVNSVWEQFRQLDEPLFYLVYWFAAKIKNSGASCIFFTALVTLGLEFRTIWKNTDQVGVGLVLFMFTCWSSCFNGMRQALAAAILFSGYAFLRDRQSVKFAIVCFIAFLCHKSSIIMIVLIFAAHLPVNKKNLILLTLASFIVLESYDIVFGLLGYFDYDTKELLESGYWSNSVNILRTLSKIAPAVFFLYVYKDYPKNPTTEFYLNMLVIHAVVALTTTNSTCLARFSMYTAPFAIMSIVELMKIFPPDKKSSYTVLITALYWFMEWYEINGSGSLNNFRFVFNH